MLKKSATVETDDPDNARIVLTVQANVLVELDLQTNQIRYKDIAIGEEKIQKIVFLTKDPSAVKFGEVKSSKKGVKAAMVRGDDASWVLEVKYKPKEVGHFTAKIDVELLEPQKKTLTAFLTANVRGDIKTLPNIVSIQKGLEGVQTKRTVRLQADEGTTFDVKKVKEETGYLELEVEEQTKGKVYLLHVRLTQKGEEADRFVTKILVHTTSKKQPVIEIPVHVKTRKPVDQKPAPAQKPVGE